MDFYPTRYSDLSAIEVDELYRAESWTILSRDERLDALQELSNRSAESLEIEPCEVKLEGMNGAQYGGYINGQILVNESLVEFGEFRTQLDDGSIASYSPQDTNAQLMDTIHHENFHAYQDGVMSSRLENANVEQVEEWRENDRNYTTESPYYRVQSIEASAFSYGEQQTTASFQAIEAKYGTDTGYQEYRVAIGENSYDAAMAEIYELEGGQQSLETTGTDLSEMKLGGLPAEREVESDQTSYSETNAQATGTSAGSLSTSSSDASSEYAM